MAQDGPKMAQDGPKMAQDWSKMAPTWPQDGSNMAPRWPKMVPKCPKMAQTSTKIAQDRTPNRHKRENAENRKHIENPLQNQRLQGVRGTIFTYNFELWGEVSHIMGQNAEKR